MNNTDPEKELFKRKKDGSVIPFIIGTCVVMISFTLWMAFSRYVSLADENASLRAENAELRTMLAIKGIASDDPVMSERLKRYQEYILKRMDDSKKAEEFRKSGARNMEN